MRYKNNPFNIRFSNNNNWVGQLTSDNGFCTFKSIDYGVRAMLMILYRYNNIGISSIEGIINRFAPSSENPTSSYVSFVSGCMCVSKSYEIDVFSPLDVYDFLQQVAFFESKYALNRITFNRAYSIFINGLLNKNIFDDEV